MLRSIRLRLVRATWERLAYLDPYWATVNRPAWRRNRAALDEFFAGGRELVERQLTRVAEICPDLRRERALDFGCGVGRLSAALAGRFGEVVGVDISERMIALARAHHAGVAGLSFVRNTRDDLQVFPTGGFDLVYSLISLQHVSPPFIRSYLAEFVRICRPGGVLLFQLPAREIGAARRNLWSMWPPTVAMRLRRVFKRVVPISPLIDIHCLPPGEVEAILTRSGADVLARWPDDSTGPMYESLVYLARKRPDGE